MPEQEIIRAASIEHPIAPRDDALFPSITERGPHTDVYQLSTPTGLVRVTSTELRSGETTANNSVGHLPASALGEKKSHPSDVAEKVHPSDASLEAGDKEYKLVIWLPDDPENPRNFSTLKKSIVTALATLLCFDVAIGSSIITGGLEPQMAEFHVSEEVVNITIALFVVGFGVGPLFLAPLSEAFGRKKVYLGSMLFYGVFTFPCGLAKNIGTLIILRLLAGLAASSPMCIGAGSIADVWEVNARGYMMACFSCVLFAGPCVGPIIGGFISGSHLGWRWMYHILSMSILFCLVVTAALMPETFAPTLLRWRAQRLRKDSGDDSFVTEQELNRRSSADMVKEMLVRPFEIMSEPIMICFSAYLSLIYSLLYAFFFAYPIVLVRGHGFTASQCGLAFISILVGIALVGVTLVPMQERYYQRKVKELGGIVPPEHRLPLMMVNAIVLPIGLFIFAWTSQPSTNWWGPVIAGIPFGFSLIGIYISANNFLVDAFSKHAASAMAAKTFIRSLCGATVPLWINYLYAGVGNNGWSGSIFAFIALAMCPIPFVFFKKGAEIRARSKRAS